MHVRFLLPHVQWDYLCCSKVSMSICQGFGLCPHPSPLSRAHVRDADGSEPVALGRVQPLPGGSVTSFQSSSWFPHISHLGAFLHLQVVHRKRQLCPSPEDLQARLFWLLDVLCPEWPRTYREVGMNAFLSVYPVTLFLPESLRCSWRCCALWGHRQLWGCL